MATQPIGHTISLLTGVLERNGVQTRHQHYPVSEYGWDPPHISWSRLMWSSPGRGKNRFVRNGFGASYKSTQLSRLKSLSEAVEAYATLSRPPLTPHTVGISAGWKKEPVLLNAIYELVEKEACILAFLLKIPLKQIDPSSDTELHGLWSRFQKHGLSLHSYKILNPFDVPVYMSILEDRSGKGPAVVVGAKAHYDEREALINSVEEAAMIHITYRTFSRRHKIIPQLPVRLPDNRSAFWADARHREKLSFLLDTPYERAEIARPAPRFRDTFRLIVSRLEAQSIRWQAVDLTPSFLKEVGYQVYQVLIPDLQQFYFDDMKKEIKTARVQIMARLYRIPTPSLNPDPHPFV